MTLANQFLLELLLYISSANLTKSIIRAIRFILVALITLLYRLTSIVTESARWTVSNRNLCRALAFIGIGRRISWARIDWLGFGGCFGSTAGPCLDTWS